MKFTDLFKAWESIVPLVDESLAIQPQKEASPTPPPSLPAQEASSELAQKAPSAPAPSAPAPHPTVSDRRRVGALNDPDVLAALARFHQSGRAVTGASTIVKKGAEIELEKPASPKTSSFQASEAPRIDAKPKLPPLSPQSRRGSGILR